jgi:uncharacterized protein
MSDIHGSASACEKALKQYEALKCDMLILLGDVLYHGPRNPLPDAYEPKKVCALLNPLADRIIACRGNCDSEVDQMVLSFPVQADFAYIADNGVRIFASHGHIYAPAEESKDTPVVSGSAIPPLGGTSVELFGHIHIQMLYKNKAGIAVCNPGSVSLPKNGSPAGFAVYENRRITLYALDGSVQSELKV